MFLFLDVTIVSKHVSLCSNFLYLAGYNIIIIFSTDYGELESNKMHDYKISGHSPRISICEQIVIK